MNLMILLMIYLIVINLIGFLAMYMDKRKAKKHAYRIPESTLFTIAAIGGSIGCICGMYTFRHKTKHNSFVYGMPAIFILQVICTFILMFLV